MTNESFPAESRDLRRRLADAVGRINIYSSHEHHCPEEKYLGWHLDFVNLFGYLGYVLSASGMPPEILQKLRDPSIGEDKKWDLFEPYRERVQYTEYFREIRIALRNLYGISDLSRDTYRAVGECLRRDQRPGIYKVLLEKSGVDYALVDSMTDVSQYSQYDPAVFGLIYRIDPKRFRADCVKQGINSSDQALESIDRFVADLAAHGVRGIKIALAVAGFRLDFRKWPLADERRAYRAFLQSDLSYPAPAYSDDKIPFLPFLHALYFRFVEQAVRHSMLVQIHLAMQSYSTGDPYFLKPLIDAFPEAVFDLFHAGYPYHGNLAVLASWFPNVYPDMCWMASVSKSLAARILSEWVEMVPVNKILGFGSDHGFMVNTYAYQVMAREIVTEVLESKIISGRFDEDEAIRIARFILRENLKTILDAQTPKRAI